MFSHSYFLNPRRAETRSRRERIKAAVQAPFIQLGLWLGFQNIDYSYVHGEKGRVVLGRRVSTMNTIFNVISGTIHIGDDTIFGHNCMVLTGTHQYLAGKRAGLHVPALEETPAAGRDITVGTGCFIGSGAIILGPATVGDNVIIGAGAVVTSNIQSGCFAAGSPARVIRVF